MSKASSQVVLNSGLLSLSPDLIESLPEVPATYRLRAVGQRVMYVGHAGAEGLREAIRGISETQQFAGIASLEYAVASSPEAAKAAAEDRIRVEKPLYNMGFGRYRNTELSLPKTGHRIRKAIRNP